MPPRPPPSLPEEEPTGPVLPSPISTRTRRAMQSVERSAVESLTIEEQMLEKLTSIEKMVGLFYRVFVWQGIAFAIIVILTCAGVLSRN